MRSHNSVAIKMAKLSVLAMVAMSIFGSLAAQTIPQGRKLDLQRPFLTRSVWRLVVTEGPPTKDYGGNDAPGALTLCLHKESSGSCISGPVTPPLRTTTPDDPIGWEPHYLQTAKFVYPDGPQAAPLLLIVTGSLNSGNGNQIVVTQLIAYDDKKDAFQRVYLKSTGHNNNEEVRFIDHGPLRGSVISAEPQQHLPYGYWIVVNRWMGGQYHQVLRYASATRYNDGNRLSVIDSEMPAIERRLGMWKPGDPLPIPENMKNCLKPVLRRDELWCR